MPSSAHTIQSQESNTFTSSPLYYTFNKAQSVALNNKYVKQSLSLVAPVTQRIQPYIEPTVKTALHKAQPLLNNVDNRLSTVVTEVQKSQWMRHVDTIIQQRSVSGTDVKQLVNEFYTAATDAFIHISHSQSQSFTEYKQAVQQKLGSLYSEDMVPLIQKFHTAAVAIYTSQYDNTGNTIKPSATELLKAVQQQLPTEYTEKLYSVLNTHITHAQQLYHSALQYIIEYKPTNVIVFITGIREQLGHTWHSSLEQPLIDLYHSVSSWAKSDLIKLQSTSNTIVSSVYSDVNDRWQSLLTHTQNVFDIVVPAVATDKQINGVNANKSLHSVREHVTKRIKSQATHKYTTAKHYTLDKANATYNVAKHISTDKVQPLIHVDPVALVEPIVVSSANKALVTLESIKRQIDELHDMLRQWTTTQRSNINTVQSHVSDTVSTLAHTGVDKVKHVLPQHIQDQVTKISTTLHTLNIKNLTDIQQQLLSLKDALTINQTEVQSNVHSTPVPQHRSTVMSPQAPIDHLGKLSMFASPIKQETPVKMNGKH